MASSHSAALAQWQRIEALVQAWLDERQQLIVLLCTLQGLKGLSDHRQPLQKQVQNFCQLLMDYISAGYFEVYRVLYDKPLGCQNVDPTDTGCTINMGVTDFGCVRYLPSAGCTAQLVANFIDLS